MAMRKYELSQYGLPNEASIAWLKTIGRLLRVIDDTDTGWTTYEFVAEPSAISDELRTALGVDGGNVTLEDIGEQPAARPEPIARIKLYQDNEGGGRTVTEQLAELLRHIVLLPAGHTQTYVMDPDHDPLGTIASVQYTVTREDVPLAPDRKEP